MTITRLRLLTSAMAVSAMLMSCGNSSSSHTIGGRSNDETFSSGEVSGNDMVTCPMCNGSGVFEFMPGDVMAPRQTCSGCQGKGQVDRATAQKIIEAKQQIDDMMGNNNGYDNSGGSGRSANEIEYDLQKAQEQLADMIENRDNCDIYTLIPQWNQMIREQKERIAQLENELRMAN